MSEVADLALIGRRVAGKFVVEQFLGGGAMGEVYRARDESLDRLVALKVMHPAIAVDPTFVTRFHREARAASRLDHPSSMRVIEFGEEPDGLLYIAMEYLQGRDLYKVIHEDWPLTEARIADIMMKALSAIAVGHDMGVIHRDLKPENIMILDRKDDEGQDLVKVCDFGIAKITERDEATPDAAPKTAGAKVTTAGLVVGTPEYMSPEQARGERLDSRSDLYSMGIILYQLLTGRTPFLADTALAVVLKHITDAPEPPRTIYPGVHAGLEAVCMRALEKTKEKRFQSAREMRAALKAAIEGRPIPLDAAYLPSAANSTAPPSLAPGSTPEASAAGSPRSSSTRPADALASSPPALGTIAATSKATPLVAALVAPEDTRSHAPVFIVGALSVLVLGGAGVMLAQTEAPSDGAAVAVDSVTAVELDKKPSAPTSTPAAAASPNADTKSSKNVLPPLPVPKATGEVVDATADASASSEPAIHEHEPTPAPTAPPTTTALPDASASGRVAPAPSVAWSPSTCRATLGAPKSASGHDAKGLTLRGTDSAWTTCARTAIRERPAAPIDGTVRIRFDVDKVYRGATCAGCTPALAQCVATSTGKTASFSSKGGDAPGNPEFEVPVTFACE